jgi:predicted nucleotidyltransferase
MESAILREIASRHGVCLMLQHGSTVTGRVHAKSDVDIAAQFESDGNLFSQAAELGADLQEYYPGREVDVGFINRADPLFLKKVLERCQLLHGSTRALAELRMYAFRRYQDHRRFLALEPLFVTRSLERSAPR